MWKSATIFNMEIYITMVPLIDMFVQFPRTKWEFWKRHYHPLKKFVRNFPLDRVTMKNKCITKL